MSELSDALKIFYLTVGVGGIMGGILTAWNKVRFVKKSDFEDHKVSCPATICAKIDTLKTTVDGLKSTVDKNAEEGQKRREADKKDFQTRRDKDNEFLNENLRNIAGFIGSVKQYMENKKL